MKNVAAKEEEGKGNDQANITEGARLAQTSTLGCLKLMIDKLQIRSR